MNAGCWRGAVALTGCLVLTGCPAMVDDEPERTTPTVSTAQALPGLPTGASTGLPAYAGPPSDAPGSLGPLLSLRPREDPGRGRCQVDGGAQ